MQYISSTRMPSMGATIPSFGTTRSSGCIPLFRDLIAREFAVRRPSGRAHPAPLSTSELPFGSVEGRFLTFVAHPRPRKKHEHHEDGDADCSAAFQVTSY